jgi:LuxR family maltose regulon positive regulatory protein
VRGWLGRLPDDVVDADSRLWLASVWTSLDSGRLAEAEPLLAATAGDGERAAWGSLLRALHTFKSGAVGSAASEVEAALGAWEHPTPFWRTVAAVTRGTTAYWRGDVPLADAALGEAEQLAGEDGNHLAQLYSLGYLALLRAERGRLEEAEAMLARADEVCAAEPGVEEYFVAMVARMARAEVAERRHRAREAAAEAGLAVTLAHRGAGLVESAAALLVQARSRRALGDREGAALADSEARALLARCPDAGRLAPKAPAAVIPAPRDSLSDRELAVLRLLPGPLSQREIGQELFLSVNTVKTHTRHIYAKLRAETREEAVGRARELGLL